MQRAKLVLLFLILILSACLIGIFKNHREIQARFFGPEAQIMGLVELYGLKPNWKKDCTKEQIKEIFEKATLEKQEVKVGCSFDLKKTKYSEYKNQTLTKRLVLEGSESSYVHINCAGINIKPLIYEGNPSLKIQSKKTTNPRPQNEVRLNDNPSSGTLPFERPAAKDLFFERPENILIEDCKIRGSIQVGGLSEKTAPGKILFDRLVIDSPGTDIPFHLMEGVSHVNLVNSVIKGPVCGLNIRLAPGSGHNVIKNNDIKAYNQKRELVHIDGSSNNVIADNYFSALKAGGISVSGNCKTDNPGEYKKSQNNLIVNNVFDYETTTPHSQGKYDPKKTNLNLKNLNKTEPCPQDKSHPNPNDKFSPAISLSPKATMGKTTENCKSSYVTRNAIVHNQITGKKITEPDPKDMEKVLFEKYLSDNKGPNLFFENKIVNEVFIYGEPVCRSFYGYPLVGLSKYGYGPKFSHVCPVCYAPNGFPRRLISHGGESISVLDKKDSVLPLKKTKICEEALLKETKKTVSKRIFKNYKIYEEFFDLTKDHSSGWFYCPNKEKLFALRVICDLQGHTTTKKELLSKKLSSMDWNSIKIIKHQGQKDFCALFENVRGTDHKIFLTGFRDFKHTLFELKSFNRSGLGIECKNKIDSPGQSPPPDGHTDQKTCSVGVQYLCKPRRPFVSDRF